MTAFEDWKRRALEADILEEARARNAKLKRAGREWIGPCPGCGGVDRFSVNVAKRIFNCRGAEGGDVIKMVQHLDGVSFLQACETLTGEPPPNGQSVALSEEEKAARARAMADARARAAAAEAQQQQYQEDTRETAMAIWNASQPIADTLAATYLCQRGLGLDEWPTCLRFHPALPYPGKSKRYPVLVCRVDDVCGELAAVWRIFLRDDGRKADVPNVKLGLGPAGGGAVRIGGLAPKIAIAEGVESAIGYWLLTGRKHPTWAALSTSGLIGFEAPLGVDHCIIAPDGDRPMRRKDRDFVPAVPAGRKAALALRARLLAEGVSCTIAAEPSAGKDYNDLLLAYRAEVA